MESYYWQIEQKIKHNRRLAILSFVISLLAFILSVYSIALNTNTKRSLNALKSKEKAVLSRNKPADIVVALESWSKKELNDDNALAFMEYLDIEHSHIVLAQMKLESGHYKSKLAKENNNYFGMKHPLKRATTSIGKKKGYASYKSWTYSVLDYALWQKANASNLTEKEYFDSLSTYAEDKKYIEKVKKLAKNLENRK